MTEKFKKIDRRYILSDSSVNVYGFRLLTAGYQAEAFKKNPVGYYMHRREDGIALKWDDIQITGDQVTALPVINLSNARGHQTCDEVENGFLNAASMGHIVVLEYSTDPEHMLPGQTGPTITRWYNKECSLVDIPGNCNALTALYDANEQAIHLADFSPLLPDLKPAALARWQELNELLQLPGDTAHAAALQHVRDLMTRTQALEAQLTAADTAQTRQQVASLLDQALAAKKLTVALRERLAADYAEKPGELKALLSALPVFQSVTETLKARAAHTTLRNWDDYEKADPSGKQLNELRNTDPQRYQELYQAKFG